MGIAILSVMAVDRAGIFISHHSAEKSVALRLQKYLEDRFGGALDVFVSSDNGSIGGGKVWFNRIRESLKAAKVVIVLLSPTSKNQDWILFEAGVGDGGGACVIPVVFNGMTFGSLGFPLGGFHGRELADIDGIVSDIRRELGSATDLLPAPLPDFDGDIALMNTGQQLSDLVLDPCFDVQTDKWMLNFRLRNRGPAVRLVKIVITVPEGALFDADFMPKVRDNILNSKRLEENGRNYRVLIYGRPSDPRRVSDGVLPEVFPRNDQLFLKYLCVPMKKLNSNLLHEGFRWQIFSVEGNCEEHSIQFKDVESCK